MGKVRTLCVALAAAAGCCLMCVADAHAEDDKNFRFFVTPYAWMTSLNGTIGVKGHTAHVDASFTSLTKHLNFAGMLEVDAVAYDTVGVTGNINAAMLGDKSSAKGASLDSNSSMILSDLALFYRLGYTSLNESGSSHIRWDVLAGGRLWDLKAKLKIRKGDKKLTASQHETWVDPIIGAKAWVHVNDDWGLELRGDIGGFDVNSKLTWGASSVVAYSLWGDGKLVAGYRAVGVNYEKGDGSDTFKTDVIMHGPIVGLMMRF